LSPKNVEGLVLYGKALLGSAIAQSAVLGGGAPTDGGTSDLSLNQNIALTAKENADASNGAGSSAQPAVAGLSNAAFSFGGDAEEEEEGEGEQGEGGEGEEEEGAPGGDREDDLESAFQVLDLARSILEKELERLESEGEGKGKGKEGDKADGHVKGSEKTKDLLADVHRLLGDVATESGTSALQL
jgi:HAT1-interacting factor 1